MGERSGRGLGRIGSDFLSAIAGRVGSGQRFAGSGRVGSKKSDPWTTLVKTAFKNVETSQTLGRVKTCLPNAERCLLAIHTAL